MPSVTCSKKVQRAVIVTAPHTQAIAIRIKGNQWHQDQIQPPGFCRRVFVTVRLLDAEAVGSEPVSRPVFAKPKRIFWTFVDDWQEALLTHAVGTMKDRGGVNFAIGTEVEGDTLAA